MRLLVLFSIIASIITVQIAYSVFGRLEVGFTGDVKDLAETGGSFATLLLQSKNIWIFLGAVLVFVFYYVRFSQWSTRPPLHMGEKPPRHFTSGMRYSCYASLYSLFFVAVYLFLVRFPELINSFSFSGASSPFDFQPLANSPDLVVPYAVIFMTVVWPQVPLFRESELRGEMQRLAYIPSEALSMAKRLENNPRLFSPDVELAKVVVAESGKGLIHLEDFSVAPPTVRGYFARCLYLLQVIKNLPHERSFMAVLSRYEDEIAEIERSVSKLQNRLATLRDDYLGASRRLQRAAAATPAHPETDEPDSDVVWKEMNLAALGSDGRLLTRDAENLKGEIAALLKVILQVVVCTVLAVEKFPHERALLFRRFGLSLSRSVGGQFTQHDWVVVAACLFIAIGVPTLAYWLIVEEALGMTGSLTVPIAPTNVWEALYWALCGAGMHLIAALVGIGAKRSLDSHRIDTAKGFAPERGHRWPADYFYAAALAFSINIFALSALSVAQSGSIALLRFSWSWAFPPAITGAAVAWHLDSLELGRAKRVATGLGQGVLTMLVAALVTFGVSEDMRLLDHEKWIFLAYAAGTNFCIGAMIGYMVPMRHDRLRRQTTNEHDRRAAPRFSSSLAGKWLDAQPPQEFKTRDISVDGMFVTPCVNAEVGTVCDISVDAIGLVKSRIVRHDRNGTAMAFLFAEAKPVIADRVYKIAEAA